MLKIKCSDCNAPYKLPKLYKYSYRPVLKACNFFKETQETPTQRFLYFDYNQSSLLCYYKNFFNLNFCLHCRCFSRNFAKLFRLVFYWAYLDVCIKLSLYHMPPSITPKKSENPLIYGRFSGGLERDQCHEIG